MSEKSQQAASEPKKAYEKPTLSKGPKLGEVTALNGKGSGNDENAD